MTSPSAPADTIDERFRARAAANPDHPAVLDDAGVLTYGGLDAAVDRLATIVRGADTSRHHLSPQCGGLFAISLGLSANFPDDHQMLKHGWSCMNALYTWCRSFQGQTHNWPSTKST